MEFAAAVSFSYAEVSVEHFMIYDELQEVRRDGPSVEQGVDPYDISCTTVSAQRDPSRSSAEAVLPPGNACCYAAVKIFAVHAIKDVGQAVNGAVVLQNGAAAGRT